LRPHRKAIDHPRDAGGFTRSATARSRSAAERTVPFSVTVDSLVDTSIARALTESSNVIFALIFVVMADSSIVRSTFAAAWAACSPS